VRAHLYHRMKRRENLSYCVPKYKTVAINLSVSDAIILHIIRLDLHAARCVRDLNVSKGFIRPGSTIIASLLRISFYHTPKHKHGKLIQNAFCKHRSPMVGWLNLIIQTRTHSYAGAWAAQIHVNTIATWHIFWAIDLCCDRDKNIIVFIRKIFEVYCVEV
jgi:hypothetical protein